MWIIYEIVGNYLSDYRIQVEFHSSQPMNFLSNTDPLPFQIFILKVKNKTKKRLTEKIELYVNISHAYVAESVDKFFIVFTRCKIIAAVKLFSQVESLLISGGPFFNFGTAQPSFGATSKFNLIPSLTYFRIASKRTRNEATSLNMLSRFQI